METNLPIKPSRTKTSNLDHHSMLVNIFLVTSIFLSAVVIVQRAWLSDDAFITYRTVDNFLNGYGLVWNVGERVQAYTHPLWMFVLSAANSLTGELIFTSLVLSIIISVAAVTFLAVRIAIAPLTGLFLVISLTLSNAFIDYSTSGLENPLTHLLITIFYLIFFTQKVSTRRIFWLSLVSSLAAINRMDIILILGPALLLALFETRSIKAVLAFILGQIPLLAWESFSIFYYGFPFPNTAYAKLNTGIANLELFKQGWLYLRESLHTDPITLVIIASAFVLAFLGRERKNIPIALGVALYLFYVIKIGGDFMSGRFLAGPFLCSLIILARFDLTDLPRLSLGALFSVVITLGLFSATPTLNFAEPDLTPSQRLSMVINDKIANERRYYRWSTGLFRIDPRTGIPNHPFAIDGLEARNRSPRLSRRITVGMFGYYAGPNIYVVDELALADPLLSRLPARRVDQWRIGHFQRTIPAGYLETLRSGTNQLLDSKLAQLYDKLSMITRANLWAQERWKAILELNTGLTKDLIDFDTYRYPKLVRVNLADVKQEVPDGTHWNAPGNTIFGESGIQIDLGGVVQGRQVGVSLDGSNAYQLVFLKDGQEIETIKIPKVSKSATLRGSCIALSGRTTSQGIDAIRVFAIQGDPDYSLGHLSINTCSPR